MKIVLFLAIIAVVRVVRSCNNDGNLKSVHGDCEDNSDCYDGGITDAVSCRNGRCECNDGYLAQTQWFAPKDRRLVCQPAPYQDQPCTSECQKPLTCASTADPDVRTCQCLLPAITKNDLCIMECPSEQIFDRGACRDRCGDGEIKGRDGCKKMANLGDECDSKDQCVTPFSQCVDGACSCVDGFSSNGTHCLSQDRFCPVGKPLRDRNTGSILECKVTRKRRVSGLSSADTLPFPRPALLEDSCGADRFCMITSGDSFYAEGAIGHCCQKPPVRCPYGRAHPSATCGASIPDKSGKISTASYCPYETHSCVRFVTGGGYEESVCCPLACGANTILIEGRCWAKRSYGDQCRYDQQCQGHVGVCKNGVCTCGREYQLDGSIGYQYCRRVCKHNEILLDTDRCLPKLKLDEKCDPILSSQCPLNAYCSSEKRVCDCYCGYMRVGDTCARQPTCPATKATTDFSSSSISVRRTINLCRISGSNSTMDELKDECPRGEYCAMYEAEYGLCCPRPKPFCPQGTTLSGIRCNPSSTGSCGIWGACIRYMYPANEQDSTEGFVCCRGSGFAAPLLPPMNLTEGGSSIDHEIVLIDDQNKSSTTTMASTTTSVHEESDDE